MHCLTCHTEIVRNQHYAESEEAFLAREASGYCRRKCAREAAAKPSHPRSRPTLSLTQQPVYEVEARGPVWKEKTVRSESYLSFIRKQVCLLGGSKFGACNGDVIPHHTETGGLSLKGSDLSCVPLCCNHHLLMDDAGKKGRGIWKPSELKAIINRMHEAYNQQRASGHKFKEGKS